MDEINSKNLVFTNKNFKSKKSMLIRILIALTAIIVSSYFFDFEYKSMIIPLTISIFIGTFINIYSSNHQVILTNETITFFNIFTQTEKVFTYNELVSFKSNITLNQFGKGTENKSFELKFENGYDIIIDENNYIDYENLKNLIYSKTKNNFLS
jgi:hypothetical protein